MKSIYFLAVGLLFISLVSCKKFLEVEPKNQVSDEQTIFDKNSATTAVNGAYRLLASDAYYGQKFQFIIYLQGGDLGWGDSRTVNLQFIQNNVKADNEEVNNVWTAIYKTINQTNHVITKVPPINSDPALTPAIKDNLVGQAHFIRALAYFDLVRTWGGVQITTTPTSDITTVYGIPRSSVADTYNQVLSDLTAAEALLPTGVNRVRATKNTVRALRARYHLYRQEWADAETYATYTISDIVNYPLVAPYNSWFATNAIGAKESILETAYSTVQLNPHRNSWQPTQNGGIRSWFPLDAFVTLINNPAIGGNRSTLVAQATNGQWYGNKYYRNPATDPSFVLRVAEQYLIRAEARANLNNLSGAIADLDLVRARAGLAPTTAVTQAEILLAIEEERRFEFSWEPHRWFDLVRTSRADEVLNLTNTDKWILPIPSPQIIVDPTLTQNPGY